MNKRKFSFIIIVLTFCYSLLMALAAVGNYINARPTTYFYLGCAIVSFIIGIISFIEYKKKQM
ncbi:hypothetical protein ACFOU2_16050 [Bacillus songklensis]|uniref:Uncharacterized protein n=1 Tax=Bacillus songklensis TaxID=1069116 RepID=A0ABV8B3U5_9BACI